MNLSIVVCVLLIGACTKAPSPPSIAPVSPAKPAALPAGKWVHQKTELGRMPDGPNFVDTSKLMLTGNGCHYAYLVKAGKKFQVLLDAVAGPEFDSLLVSGPYDHDPIFISSNGDRVAYAVEIDGKKAVITDDKIGPFFDEINTRFIRFSPNGQHVAYTARKGDRWHLVVDEMISPGFDAPPQLLFSPDGSRFAYAGDRGKLYLDGIRLADPHFRYTGMAFSPDGKHFVYRNNQLHPVLDGKVQSEFPENSAYYFESDGTLVYAMHADRKWTVVRNGISGPPSEVQPMFFNGYTERYSKVAQVSFEGDPPRWLIDGQPFNFSEKTSLAANDVYPSQVGPMFANIFYRTAGGDVRKAVLNGPVGPSFDYVEDVILTNDGRRLLYVGGDWIGDRFPHKVQMRVVVDSVPGPVFSRIADIAWSGDGSRLAYRATLDFEDAFSFSTNAVIVLDGQVRPDLKVTGDYIFSTDGKRFAYVGGNKEDNGQSVIIDGQSGPIFNGGVLGLVVRKDGALEYLASEKGSDNELILYRVVVGGFSPSSALGAVPLRKLYSMSYEYLFGIP